MKNIENEFINYLISHGYPQESIRCEWRTNNIVVDIAILDLDTYLPIAIYEFKISNEPDIVSMGINQLKKIASQIEYPVKCGMVLAKKGSTSFKVIDVTDKVYGPMSRFSTN